ncbi:RNA polymerase sigma factor SigA2 [Anatilimnocola aggregata]|uniref:RNA polymerase sigma factor SigA2 n=1 Tax=Anatilimnocola aggregata TaxID=2528021 RepID=A0A517YLJ4_9BACT|nr:sigma-70 family RNA polymerase sigma factor [Anatilimnocola aggregata]QDU31068.1 RNA polymerase sigma factor SigA2 [Anatilimnocola aggregata]
MILLTARSDADSNSPTTESAPRRSASRTLKQWREAAHQLAALEPEFMYNAAFRSPRHGREIMAALPLEVDPREQQWQPGKGMPVHLARLCEAKLLKPAEEVALFRRMNYCKYEADRLRRKLNPQRPNRELVHQIEACLLQAKADRDRIVRANLRLVVSIAKKFANPRLAFDDLLSEGIGSLLRAAEKFDYDRGFRFSTYATQAVRRTLCRYLQNSQRDDRRFVNADALLFEDQHEEQTDPALTESRWEDLRRNLKRLLARLDPRERAIIRRRFGLDEQAEVQTLQSLAEELGVCKERVRQLEMRAISKLRTLAEKVKLAPPEEA